MKVKIQFTKDYAGNKKGDVKEYSRDNANMIIGTGNGKIYVPKKAKTKSK